MSFAPCTMHILFNSNKFHKFSMSCACRNPLSKDGRNQRKPRPPGTFHADRPDTSTYMGPIILLEQCDMVIRFQNKANISYPVGGPGRHKVQTKDPQAVLEYRKRKHWCWSCRDSAQYQLADREVRLQTEGWIVFPGQDIQVEEIWERAREAINTDNRYPCRALGTTENRQGNQSA